MRIKRAELIENLIFLLLMMVGIQFRNQPQNFVFALGFFLVVYAIGGKKVRVPLEFIILACAFTLYFAIFYSNQSIIYTYHYAAYWLAPIVGYLLGYMLILKKKNRKYIRIGKILTAICAGTTAFALGCVVYKMLNMGMYQSSVQALYVTMQGRYSLNMWNGELVHPTNLNSMCVFPIILLFYVVNYVKDKKVRIAYWVSLFVAVVVLFVTATRTNIVMLPITWMIGLWSARGDIQFKLTRKQVLFIAVAAVAVLVFSYRIVDFLENSLLATRTESLDNNRIKSITNVLSLMGKYPMGNIPTKANAHNMWVDVGRVAGIIPMVLLMVYSALTLKTLFRLRRKKNIPTRWKTLFMLLTIGLLVTFMIEPVIAGRPFNFMFSCVINGMCAALVRT